MIVSLLQDFDRLNGNKNLYVALQMLFQVSFIFDKVATSSCLKRVMKRILIYYSEFILRDKLRGRIWDLLHSVKKGDIKSPGLTCVFPNIITVYSCEFSPCWISSSSISVIIYCIDSVSAVTILVSK